MEVVGDGRDRAIEEGGEEVNGVCVDVGTFVVCCMSDGVAYVTWKGINLVAWKRGGVGITQRWDSGGVQLFDMGYVCGT